ncbi:MAG TPA: hypothetical protein ENL40_07425, partial [Thermococcus litoralis]|nr:hypothetical protein [Thermococcus litoralis]
MKIGVSKLDELLGEIEPGSTILISTIGELGIEIVLAVLRENKEKAIAFVTPRLKKRLKKTEGIDGVIYFTLGEDFAPQELFKITHAMREVPEDRFVGIFFLQPLLVFHPPETAHRFFSELANIALERGFVLMSMVDKRLLDNKTLAIFEESATHVIDIVE